MTTKIFGYFSNDNQTTPEFDPGLDVLCPVCMLKLKKPIVTYSLLKPGDLRSYFYRVHKQCSGKCDEINRIESSLIDSI